ncbi:hypothetical protein GUJ93_ZPchr0008g11774 [Zizania palustris]|uniref:Uncharacterized protein n=1 Tax=Zizania palustris TaxID=103762 RepID=A0A8J5V4R6_ZIZPA|nr:hypothetical protein GUJ93_ZPchr0008g11774 [Zizania palustris]
MVGAVVEDVMPIAMGLEHEELVAELKVWIKPKEQSEHSIVTKRAKMSIFITKNPLHRAIIDKAIAGKPRRFLP